MLDLGTPREPLFDGEDIIIQGTTIHLSEWNLRTTRAGCEARQTLMRAQRKEIPEDSDEAISATRHLIFLSLQMNYPEVTEDYLDGALRLRDVRKLAKRIMEVNATDDDDEGEAKAPETGPQTPLMNGTTSLS